VLPLPLPLPRPLLRGVCSYLDGRAGSKFPDGANRPHEDGAEHLREAISIIGAQRIMYGSDTSAISTNYSILDNLRTAIEAQLSAGEREQIAWKTANQPLQTRLEGLIRAGYCLKEPRL
jgi:hypothetical protein